MEGLQGRVRSGRGEVWVWTGEEEDPKRDETWRRGLRGEKTAMDVAPYFILSGSANFTESYPLSFIAFTNSGLSNNVHV